MFGTGPGALPSDARTFGISPLVLRDRQDEALGIIIRLLEGEERFTYVSEWFELHDAALQILPVQERVPMATASSISPSGMKIAGKYGIGVLSIASNSLEGLQALPTQWGFAEESARQHGKTVDRKDWRVLMAWHLAETREQARNEAVQGLHRWHNEYNVRVLGRPDAVHVEDQWALMDQVAGGEAVGGGAPDQPGLECAALDRRLRAGSAGDQRVGRHRGDAECSGTAEEIAARQPAAHHQAAQEFQFSRHAEGSSHWNFCISLPQ